MARVLVIFLLVLVGCGDERSPGAGGEETPAPRAGGGETPAPGPGERDTRLVVEVRPTGDDPARRRVVRELPRGITAADLEPVPAATACAEVYGGPATARIDGTLDGEPVHAAFDRTNACEMARWDRVEALLGPAPTRP